MFKINLMVLKKLQQGFDEDLIKNNNEIKF
jgi:hypothetical protein